MIFESHLDPPSPEDYERLRQAYAREYDRAYQAWEIRWNQTLMSYLDLKLAALRREAADHLAAGRRTEAWYVVACMNALEVVFRLPETTLADVEQASLATDSQPPADTIGRC